MKASEVLQLLKITRPTLTKYVKEGKIKVTIKGNGQYDYDVDSVYKMLNKDIERKTYLYARVSTVKQKKDLENQIQLLKNYCFQNGLQINGIKVVITYKDRLSRVGFELFSYLFKKYGCEIIVVSEVGSEKLDSEEIFEEIVSLLHCYSVKLYSKRKGQKIKSVLEEKDDNT